MFAPPEDPNAQPAPPPGSLPEAPPAPSPRGAYHDEPTPPSGMAAYTPPPEAPAKPLPKPRLRRRSLLREIADTILTVVAIYTLVHLIMPRYIVDGQSMEPNFHTGEWIMVSRLTYLLGEPERGDVVIVDFNDPDEKDLIKRVVGLPGETVEIRGGAVYINGEMLYEPYIRAPIPSRIEREWTLGPDEYIVLGDNRTNSRDSRSFGPISRDSIVGLSWAIYWPPESWGVIPHYDYDETPPPPSPTPTPGPTDTPDAAVPAP